MPTKLFFSIVYGRFMNNKKITVKTTTGFTFPLRFLLKYVKFFPNVELLFQFDSHYLQKLLFREKAIHLEKKNLFIHIVLNVAI